MILSVIDGNALSRYLNITEELEKPSFIEQAQQYWMYEVATVIDEWWFLILVPIGFIGNFLSMVVMAMKHNRHLSTCTYMMAISINGNILMCIFLYQWLLKNTNVQQLTDVICRTVAPPMLIFVYNGTFQVILMTLDKCLAVRFPHKALSYCTPERAKILLLIAFFSMLAFNSPHFYLTRFVISDCAAYAVKGKLITAYLYLSFVVTSIIPFISLVGMNFIIIQAVRNSRKLRTQNQDTDQRKMKQVETQLTVMCVIIASTYIILFLPSYLRFILYQIIPPNSSPKTFAGFYLFVHLSFRLYASNYGIHFFLYLLSGTKFRNDLKKLLRIREKLPRQSQSHSKSQSTIVTSSEMSTVNGKGDL